MLTAVNGSLTRQHQRPVPSVRAVAFPHIGQAEARKARIEHVAPMAGGVHPAREQLCRIDVAMSDVFSCSTPDAVVFHAEAKSLRHPVVCVMRPLAAM